MAQSSETSRPAGSVVHRARYFKIAWLFPGSPCTSPDSEKSVTTWLDVSGGPSDRTTTAWTYSSYLSGPRGIPSPATLGPERDGLRERFLHRPASCGTVSGGPALDNVVFRLARPVPG